jgi:hopene-associated glycosyltransferase HpnB
MLTAAALLALAAWSGLLLTPGQPWRNRHLLAALGGEQHDLGDITVLIPARDEAEVLPRTLAALRRQGTNLHVVLVDDQSGDGTAEAARAAMPVGLEVLRGQPLPAGWSGKVWAQHQGEARAQREFIMLLDADIELAPGMLAALRARATDEDLALVSIMARLRTDSPWERLLVPPFIYFFKLVYPFAASNRPQSSVAAAAGGCVLLRRAALRAAGGFATIRGAIIDDCALAQRIKAGGGRTWIGQSLDVVSRRGYDSLRGIWDMVARTAFTQLGYSPVRLTGCTLAMLLAFVVPVLALCAGGPAALAGGAALALMMLSVAPTLRLLELPLGWAATLPLAAVLYLAMTWASAIRYWRGERSRWRGRRYPREGKAT